MKKVMSIVLACVLLLSSCLTASAVSETSKATTTVTGKFSIVDYNISGLPDFSAFVGGEVRDVKKNQVTIANFISENQFDIVAVQEDFSYHKTFTGALEGYNYSTFHHGGVPYGDGTNIYTTNHKIYNETHTPWDTLYGIIDDGADQFSQKGITYACVEIAQGVYIDIYNIHADAFGDAGSLAARKDNFDQLAKIINSRKVNRPVIVTGDFNEYFFNYNGSMADFCVDNGFKDSWIEIYNESNYNDLIFQNTNKLAKWGNWDSAERFMYRDGDGVELKCETFNYQWITNEDDGSNVSDHAAASSIFTFTVTDESLLTDSDLEVVKYSHIAEIWRRMVKLFSAIKLAVNEWDTIAAYLGI